MFFVKPWDRKANGECTGYDASAILDISIFLWSDVHFGKENICLRNSKNNVTEYGKNNLSLGKKYVLDSFSFQMPASNAFQCANL